MQFPTDDDSEDTIEQAIRLVTDPAEKVTLNSLDIIIKVKASLNIYSTCQEEIKACTDQVSTLTLRFNPLILNSYSRNCRLELRYF